MIAPPAVGETASFAADVPDGAGYAVDTFSTA